MTYALSRVADDDIIRVFVLGAQLFGLEQAENYYQGLVETFHTLGENPRIARQRMEISPPVRIFPYRAHVIVYLIENNGGGFILRVRHGREDWESEPV
jgi:toxin ParE1/3/4